MARLHRCFWCHKTIHRNEVYKGGEHLHEGCYKKWRARGFPKYGRA